MNTDVLRKAKPCPFCGSYNLMIGMRESYSGETYFWIECEDCDSSGPYSGMDEDIGRSKVEALLWWNHRVPT
jgi:Lar family restriction alleviation protein